MFVILCYDVEASRISRVRKTAKKYLRPVQRSVLEGFVTEGELNRLKKELLPCIEPTEDQVRIYVLGTTAHMHMDELGIVKETSPRFL